MDGCTDTCCTDLDLNGICDSQEVICGDGILSGTELCDFSGGVYVWDPSVPVALQTPASCVDCSIVGVCGDGYADTSGMYGTGEECGEPGLSCGTTGDNCVACACEPGTCGDGFTGVNEECDDGNLNPLDGCTDTCCVDVDLDGICDSDTEFTKTASLYDHTITYHINGYIPASGGAQTITLVDLLS
ncbi:MAG: hypothetical protein H6765_10580 [Candidatus Peribacteria bacterium]|nr:MAG: hypothetical protein H6765_10580 [Candidatus Peribacteria bacterium]